MKIGVVRSSYDGPLPWKSGMPISFGPFVPEQTAPQFCPQIFFRFPIRRPVTAIVWRAPRANGYYVTAQLFDWSKCDDRGTVETIGGEISGICPQFAEVAQNPGMHLRVLLKCAEDYWQPFTSLKAASRLLPGLIAMNKDEREDFLEKLGQHRNRQTRRVWRENLFIASRWEE